MTAPTRRRRKKRPSPHKELLKLSRPHYEEMLAIQDGLCGICRREPSAARKFDMDHDHKLLYIRGLLCHRCNRAIPSWMTAKWCYATGDYLAAGPFELGDGTIITLKKENS